MKQLNSENNTRKRHIEEDDKRLYSPEDLDCDEPNSSREKGFHHKRTVFLQLCICLISGIVFGLALEKGRVFEPRVIRGQMLMKRFILLKMFTAAVASGLLSLSLLAMLPQTRRKFHLASRNFFACLSEKGVLACSLGGAMLGAGMSLSGACPGIVLAQIGAGTFNSEYTLLGALFGAVLYGLLEGRINSFIKPFQSTTINPLKEEYTAPYFILTLPLVAMLSMFVFGVELLVPWTREVQLSKKAASSIFASKAWPPYICGAVIGLLQVPIVLSVEDTLGGSSSYCTVVSQIFIGPLRRVSPYLRKFRTGIGNWWQVFYVLGGVIGAYLSATASGKYGWSKGVPISHAFLGGAMMIVGARIAGGCTSVTIMWSWSIRNGIAIHYVIHRRGNNVCWWYSYSPPFAVF